MSFLSHVPGITLHDMRHCGARRAVLTCGHHMRMASGTVRPENTVTVNRKIPSLDRARRASY